MYEKGVPVTIGGKPCTLVFTLAALMMLTDRYGGVQEMAEAFNGPDVTDEDTPEEATQKLAAKKKARLYGIKETPWLIATLANQGYMLEHGPRKADDPELLTPETVALQVLPRDMRALNAAFMEAISIGMGTLHGEGEDAETDVVLEELEQKNAAGAAE